MRSAGHLYQHADETPFSLNAGTSETLNARLGSAADFAGSGFQVFF